MDITPSGFTAPGTAPRTNDSPDTDVLEERLQTVSGLSRDAASHSFNALERESYLQTAHRAEATISQLQQRSPMLTQNLNTELLKVPSAMNYLPVTLQRVVGGVMGKSTTVRKAIGEEASAAIERASDRISADATMPLKAVEDPEFTALCAMWANQPCAPAAASSTADPWYSEPPKTPAKSHPFTALSPVRGSPSSDGPQNPLNVAVPQSPSLPKVPSTTSSNRVRIAELKARAAAAQAAALQAELELEELKAGSRTSAAPSRYDISSRVGAQDFGTIHEEDIDKLMPPLPVLVAFLLKLAFLLCPLLIATSNWPSTTAYLLRQMRFELG